MPNILRIGGYYVFFWTNDKNEPVHVHVAKRHKKGKSTKLWLTKSGSCLKANNDSRIPKQDLTVIMRVVELNHDLICQKWKKLFAQKDLKFYC